MEGGTDCLAAVKEYSSRYRKAKKRSEEGGGREDIQPTGKLLGTRLGANWARARGFCLYGDVIMSLQHYSIT